MNEYPHGEYIIYADESGDHSMSDVYKSYPVFILAFCIFSKREYITGVVQSIKEFKFTFWGHDMTVLHSSKLRKQLEDFQFLNDPGKRVYFIEKLNVTIEHLPFEIVCMGIDKRHVMEPDFQPSNPYELSVKYCIEEVYQFLQEKNQHHKLTHIIIESRGKKEDKDLASALEKIIETNESLQAVYPIRIIFADKKTNSVGLQVADLVAYPIGRFLVAPEQKNLAFEIVERKFRKYPNHLGKGLKIFPQNNETFKKRKTPDFSEV